MDQGIGQGGHGERVRGWLQRGRDEVEALRSGPCTAVVAGRRLFIFDSGSGASRNLARMRLNAGQIEALFLTHYHSDHIDGLGELMLQRWIQRTAQQPLPVYGPAGLEPVLQGFMGAYTLDKGYRTAHHGAAVAPPEGFGGTARPFDLPSVHVPCQVSSFA